MLLVITRQRSNALRCNVQRIMREQSLQRAFFLGLLLLVTVAFLWLIRPFFKPVFWAVVLATL